MKFFFISFICLIVLSCSNSDSGSSSNDNTGSEISCSTAESDLTKLLGTISATDSLPYTYVVQRLSDGRKYSYSTSGYTSDTVYESASTSKMVSALIILRAVDSGSLSLTSKPQDFLTSSPVWPLTNSDLLYTLTLTDLLSFTSGLSNEPLCQNLAAGNFSNCVNSIASLNAGGSVTPSTEFYYASTHLQVAGLMAVKAKSLSTWQELFSAFQSETGLFSQATYDLPSSTNPRLAGGMHWSAQEYISFLYKLAKGELLSSAMMTSYLIDRTASTTMTYSPVKSSSLNEEWHYGFGYWHECQNSSWNCESAQRISSPGAYGAYPFWDRQYNYVGLVARQSASTGTFPYGLTIERSVRSLTQKWVSCQ